VAFADLHCALAFAAAGDRGQLGRLADELRAREAAGKQPAGPVVSALVAAVTAFADGRYAAAADALEPHLGAIVRVGGSNAQREVFEDTFIAACVRSGDLDRALPVLRARLDRRPSPRDAALLAASPAA
jgi:hypothetical protein